MMLPDQVKLWLRRAAAIGLFALGATGWFFAAYYAQQTYHSCCGDRVCAEQHHH